MVKARQATENPASAGFSGFRPAAFSFFRGLARHNDPLWFKPRKSVYDTEVLAPFRALLRTLTERLEAAAVPLVGDPGRSIFRIYRDVRFSTSSSTRRIKARYSRAPAARATPACFMCISSRVHR